MTAVINIKAYDANLTGTDGDFVEDVEHLVRLHKLCVAVKELGEFAFEDADVLSAIERELHQIARRHLLMVACKAERGDEE